MPILSADLISLFLLGFFGTGHCLGMCGPLIVAIPGRAGGWHAHMLYHLGRVSTYTLVGAVLGGIGGGMAASPGSSTMRSLIYLQIAVCLAAALLLLTFGLQRVGLLREPAWLALADPQRIPGFRRLLAGATRDRKKTSLFAVGLMLGLLPCGLSYAAFVRSLASPGPLSGGLLTFAFGLGTLPGLLLLGTGTTALFRRYRAHADLAAGLIMIGMAVSLLAKVMGA